MSFLPSSSPPTSPIRRNSKPIPAGFRAPPKPKPRPIAELTVRELQDLHDRNAKILASPGATTSSYVQRISAEQTAVKSRLIELDGMEVINTGLRKTRIKSDEEMNVDQPQEAPVSRALEAKRKALSRFAPENGMEPRGSLSLQEAINLEQQAHAQDRERQERILEKKRRLGLPLDGKVMTKEEREARIWAFMNHKPTDSDMEDDDEEDEDDDDDPANWFDDDQDDGRKGQDLIEPDIEDFTDIIRVDESRLHYNTFYRDGD